MSESAEPAFKVVVNREEQYSIWPEGRAAPAGWREECTSGTREECLDWIEQVWTDMRPRSLRREPEQTGERAGGRL